MEKSFLAVSIIFLIIVSMTAILQHSIFNNLPVIGSSTGSNPPLNPVVSFTDTPVTSPNFSALQTNSQVFPFNTYARDGSGTPTLKITPQADSLTVMNNPFMQSSDSGSQLMNPEFPSSVLDGYGQAPAPSSDYRLYDSFNSLRNDLWTISSYKPDSDTLTTTFMPSNVLVSDGKLVLRSYVDNNVGGEYKSNGKYYLGNYRASIKVNQTAGSYLTFFAYVWPSDQGTNTHNEIDIELIKDHGKTEAMLSTWQNYVRTQYLYTLPFDPSASYHTYGFDWYTDRVEFFIDDTSKPVWASYSNIPVDPMYVYFNNWVEKNPPASHGNGVSSEYVDWVTVE